MNLLDRGKLFTTEPELNRALASEMRFDPTATQTLMRDIIGITGTGPLESVTCERVDHANLDILVTFERAKVGVECKIGHQLSQAQWEAELEAVDHLIAIVKDTSDVPEEAVSAGVLVCTWSHALSVFRNSRVGIDDVNSLNDEKRVARRQLVSMDLKDSVPAGWSYEEKDGDGGYPSVIITSDLLDPDRRRWIIVQIERSRSSDGYIANAGVSVHPEDFGQSATEPEWLRLVRELGRSVERFLAETEFPISTTPGTHRRNKDGSPSPSTYKIQAAREFNLPLHYATGYTNSYIGVRSNPLTDEDLAAAGRLFLSAAQTAGSDLEKYLADESD